jgi:hypothetical protein
MADETPEALSAEIDHLRRLSMHVIDERVRAEIQKMIEELEQRLSEVCDKH